MLSKHLGSFLLCLNLFIFASLIGKSQETICGFCGKDFVVLGRHSWRCKDRLIINSVTVDNPITADNGPSTHHLQTSQRTETISHSLANTNNVIRGEQSCDHDNDSYTCFCGRKCAGLRGFQAHKRSCRVLDIPDLRLMFELGPDPEPDPDDSEETNTDSCSYFEYERVSKLPGIKLPKSEDQWKEANEHFKTVLPYNSEIAYIEDTLVHTQKAIYQYFSEKYGCVNTNIFDGYSAIYGHLSKRQLKLKLRELKTAQYPREDEIKFVSGLLHSKYNPNKKKRINSNINHELQIKSNFSKYCRSTFESKENVKPCFDESTCYTFFKNRQREKHVNKSFSPPVWMKKLNQPSKEFDLSPPSYREIVSIIRKMKSSGSPCPFDQISVIVLKRCPIVRTMIWKIIEKSWEIGKVPTVWKNGLTVLIHKNGVNTDPGNFRPITLEPVLCKVFTSWMRNRIYKHLCENEYIETNIQKGFWSGISGTIEHTQHLTYLINHARLKQRSLCVSLIDLKNAFGEVHHDLIKAVLAYHHVPPPMPALVRSLYDGFKISVAGDGYVTNPIRVDRGVLQGDSLSPLLFNMCVNTLINTIKELNAWDIQQKRSCHRVTGSSLLTTLQ